MLDPRLFTFLKKYYPTILYNTYQYQKYSGKIATCGRWCMLVVGLLKVYPNLDLDIINKIILQYKKKTGLSFDEIVASLINFDI